MKTKPVSNVETCRHLDMESKTHSSGDIERVENVSRFHLPKDQAVGTGHLYQEDKDGNVIERLLLPRPTDNPKDPLTWGLWRKHLAMLSECFFVFLSSYTTTSISPIMVPVVEEFNIDFNRAGYLITFNVLFLGLGNLFWIPLAQKIGKRPVIILSTLIFFLSNIWSAVATDYGSLFGSRLIQGFGASSSEALGPAIVADLYFLHERGLWIGVYQASFFVGTALGAVFSGLIAGATPDWRWVFWHNVILTGVLFLFTVIFQAETNFKRPPETESGEGMPESQLAAIRSKSTSSWVQSLSVTSYFDREVSMWQLWWRPWLTLRFPAVIWSTVTIGACLAWVVLQQTANGGIFPATYNFSAQAVGNINIGYVPAAIIGAIIGGPVSDWTVTFITKRRGGYFLAEDRLWCLIPPYIFGPIGLMLWGAGLQNRLAPMIPIVGTAIGFGVLCAIPITSLTYVVDSYRPLAAETVTMVTAAKNTFAFALSFAVFPWLERDGFVKVSGWNVLIEGVFFLTTIPMYIYGARLRQWSSKYLFD